MQKKYDRSIAINQAVCFDLQKNFCMVQYSV